jgi:CheY-specific phosphatase CheX
LTPASNKPDLHSIGETAFTEVLGTLLSLSATVRESANDRPVSAAPDEISSSVLLTGQRISGSVHLRLPLTFVAYAVRRLTGLDGDAGNASELQDDAAGELANMVAGRVASQLAAHAYPCKLGTPSVSRSARLATKNQKEAAHGAHPETATAGPRTVPVRSSIGGGEARECSTPPRPSDVLRAGTARAPVGVSRHALAHERTDLICEGHWLSLEIQCCYADP